MMHKKKIKLIAFIFLPICIGVFVFFNIINSYYNIIKREAGKFVEEQFKGNKQYVLDKTTDDMKDYIEKNGLHSENVQFKSIGRIIVVEMDNDSFLAIVTVYVYNSLLNLDTHYFVNLSFDKYDDEWIASDIALDI